MSNIEDPLITVVKDNQKLNYENDLESLISMGYDEEKAKKVLSLLKPKNINEAVDYLSEKNEIVQHNFIKIDNKENECYICGAPPNKHINNGQKNLKKCMLCGIEFLIDNEHENSLPCDHTFCSDCYLNYFDHIINNNKFEKITCMQNECTTVLSSKFIKSYVKGDEKLLKKYEKYELEKKPKIIHAPDRKVVDIPKYRKKSNNNNNDNSKCCFANNSFFLFVYHLLYPIIRVIIAFPAFLIYIATFDIDEADHELTIADTFFCLFWIISFSPILFVIGTLGSVLFFSLCG